MRFPMLEQVALPVVFDSFIAGQPHADGRRYLPVLAEARPIPLGREFQLYPEAFWSDGKRVTGVDVANATLMAVTCALLLNLRQIHRRASEAEEVSRPGNVPLRALAAVMVVGLLA